MAYLRLPINGALTLALSQRERELPLAQREKGSAFGVDQPGYVTGYAAEAREPRPGLLGRAVAQAPGTCGELAQGVLDGEHFHITCPIDVYATATVELVAGTAQVCAPASHPKACRGVELTLAYLGRAGVDARLWVSSPLPRGKGMASSTADVAAAIGATAAALGVRLSPAEVARLALQVEPSDGLMFPGIAQFDHRQGTAVELLGAPPAMRLLVLDFGGCVDTLVFNAVDRSALLQRLEPRWREAAALVAEGVRTGDVRLVGRGATVSALAHQQVLPKPQLAPVLALAREVGAWGVNVAHSGTVLGMLFADDPPAVAGAAVRARERLAGLEAIYDQRLVGGGVIAVRLDGIDHRSRRRASAGPDEGRRTKDESGFVLRPSSFVPDAACQTLGAQGGGER